MIAVFALFVGSVGVCAALLAGHLLDRPACSFSSDAPQHPEIEVSLPD